MAAISLFTNCYHGHEFGSFRNFSVFQKSTSLFGEKKCKEEGNVLCDLFQYCFVCGMIVAAKLIPAAKLNGKWFKTEDSA